jgi:lantibiotic modifying enzyme
MVDDDRWRNTRCGCPDVAAKEQHGKHKEGDAHAPTRSRSLLSRTPPGRALVHAALDDVFPGVGHLAGATNALEQALRQLGRASSSMGLYGGLSGIGWTVAHLVGDTGGDDDPCLKIDEVLRAYLGTSPWKATYDLIDGLVGIGVYALARLPRPSGGRLLARVVSHLDETARRQRPGAAWWYDPKWTPRAFRVRPYAEVNLGVAHGVPGIIALLGLVVAADIDARTTKRARARLDGAMEWLLSQELPAAARGCFAFGVGKNSPREPARLAWCYGDPGIAATLLVAARATKERAWEREAVRIALRAAERPQADSGVKDAGLCHGAAGAAHVFHRLFRQTGEPRLAEAARRWFTVALAMRRQRGGFAGFRAFTPDRAGRLAWRSDPGFLTGAGGVTLALIAATTDVDPSWDRVMLLS